MQLTEYDIITQLTTAQENAANAGWTQDQMAPLNAIAQAEVAAKSDLEAGKGQAGDPITLTALFAKYNSIIADVPQ